MPGGLRINFKFFLHLLHLHTCTYTHFDSCMIFYPVLINPKETQAEISSTPHREDLTPETVVNIRTKPLSGTSICREHAAESTNDQNDELNLCVLVVYSMTFWFLYSTFESTISFYLCRIVKSVLLDGVGIASSDIMSYQMCIVLFIKEKNNRKNWGGGCM